MINNKQTNRSIQKSKTISKTNQPGDRNRKKKKKKKKKTKKKQNLNTKIKKKKKKKKKTKKKQLWNTKSQLTKELYTLKNSREQSSGLYILKGRKNGSVG